MGENENTMPAMGKIGKNSEKNALTVIFSGFAGSGKSSLARAIAKKYCLKYVCGGDILKEMAKESGYKITESDWWETQDGINFLSQRKGNFDFDKRLDKLMLEKAKEGGCAITSWAIPWLGASGIKIWVEVSQKVRAQRIAGRDGITFGDALEAVKKRDNDNIELYKKMYGYTLGKDLDVFDLVLDANTKSVDDLAEEISAFIFRFEKKH